MAQNRQSKTAISLDIYGKFHQFAALTCIENPEDKKKPCGTVFTEWPNAIRL